MKLTNKLDLPQAIVDAVKNDSYTRGGADISVTGLLSPPRKAALDILHADELEEDASERIWSLMGQAIHTILERANTSGISERRLSTEIEGWKVSGGMDAYYPATGLLQDYKTTSVYKFLGDGIPPEYEQQLNCYAEMLRQNGDTVKRLEIVGILRDWSKMEARRNPAYPQAQVITVRIPLWESAKTQAFMRERVILHKQARITLPECSPEDRWERPTKFAVMKKGGKRAVKLYDSERAASEHASLEPNLFVEKRQGESVRCGAYCSASKFCTQFKSLTQETEQAVEPAVSGL